MPKKSVGLGSDTVGFIWIVNFPSVDDGINLFGRLIETQLDV